MISCSSFLYTHYPIGLILPEPRHVFSVKFISLPLNNLLMSNLLTTFYKGDIMSITAKNVEISKKREV